MNKVIISLIGVKKSGKSTSAEIIQELLPDAKCVAIADKLKIECANALDMDLIYFHSQDLKEASMIYPIRLNVEALSTIIENFKLTPDQKVNISSEALLELATMKMKTPRHVLQNVGMFIRDVFGNKIHMQHLDLSNQITIVSDVRMKSEFEYLNNLKGYTHIPIYVSNKQAEASKDMHKSEKEYLKFRNKCIKLDNNVPNLITLVKNIQTIIIDHKEVIF